MSKALAHPVRRKDNTITLEESHALLKAGQYCVLATVDAEGSPYATPLSYVFLHGKIYLHCAHEGHKIDNLRANPRCSLAVVGKTQPVYTKNFTTYYESVVIFGVAQEVLDAAEKTEALMAVAQKYLPEHMEKADNDIANSLSRTAVYRIQIEKITGKAKRSIPA